MPSKLEQLQLQFRQRLLQEKEERMIKIHTDNQQKALSKVTKYTGTYSSRATPQSHHSPIKKGSPGVDRSRPLPPLAKDPPKYSRVQPYSYTDSKNGHRQQSECSSSGESSPTNAFGDSPIKFSSSRFSKASDTLKNGYHAQRTYSSNRSSPTSAPSESAPRTPLASSRSRSVDLEPRSLIKSKIQTSQTMVKNGYSRPTVQETVNKRDVTLETKPDLRTLTKVKQLELQRLKANSKVREENSTSNGSTPKSLEIRKPVKSSPVATSLSRLNPKAQTNGVLTKKSQTSKPSRTSVDALSTARKPPGPGQEQCSVCGRNFNQDRIEKHASVCKKATQKKVKVFDATKMRVKGTEAEQFVRKGMHKAEPKPSKKSDWRKKHSDFIETIRQAKMVQQHLAKGGKVSDLPPPPPSDTSDYVPCPHCGRKFNESVAERHIPKCKNILSNKKNPNVPPKRKF